MRSNHEYLGRTRLEAQRRKVFEDPAREGGDGLGKCGPWQQNRLHHTDRRLEARGWGLGAGGRMPTFNTGEQLTSQVHITHQVILSKTESCWCLDHCPPSPPPHSVGAQRQFMDQQEVKVKKSEGVFSPIRKPSVILLSVPSSFPKPSSLSSSVLCSPAHGAFCHCCNTDRNSLRAGMAR